MKLPPDIIYEVTKFLDPPDILNLLYVFRMQPKESFYTDIDVWITNLSRGNTSFIKTIKRIVRDKMFIDYDIIKILGEIFYIIKQSSKYMDILGFNAYIFNIKKGSPYISKYTVPIIYADTQIINIYFPNVNTLQEYLETYMNFKNDYNHHETNTYKVKNYMTKFLM